MLHARDEPVDIHRTVSYPTVDPEESLSHTMPGKGAHQDAVQCQKIYVAGEQGYTQRCHAKLVITVSVHDLPCNHVRSGTQVLQAGQQDLEHLLGAWASTAICQEWHNACACPSSVRQAS